MKCAKIITFAVIAVGMLLTANAHAASIDLLMTGKAGDTHGAVWPDPRFETNADTSLTDLFTGLIWAPDGNTPTVVGCSGGIVTWQQALDYVVCLNTNNYLGHDDWRVPNLKEFQSLVHFGYSEADCGGVACTSPSDWLNNQGFSNMQASRYWGSNTIPGGTGISANHIHMADGSWGNGLKAGYMIEVLPVRGTAIQIAKTGATTAYDANDPKADDGALQEGVAWPTPRFTDNGDGTVTDELTGLMWLKDANCIETHDAAVDPDIDINGDGKMLWQDASDFIDDINNAVVDISSCESYSASYTDWRMPNVLEIGSLVDAEQADPALPTGHPFTNWGSPYYWSTTIYLPDDDQVFTVSFSSGGQGHTHIKAADEHFVWPVRGGLYGDPDIEVASSVGMGEVAVGAEKDADIVISNAGTNLLYLGTIGENDALAAPFSIVADPCSNTTVLPGENCTITARFAPDAEGAANDSFNIPMNDPNEKILLVTLSGTGMSTATAAGDGSPPSACSLVYPSDGLAGLGTDVTFIWKMATDGDEPTYDLDVCESDDFSGCATIEDVAVHIRNHNIMTFAKSWVASLITGPFALAGCGGSTGTATTGDDAAPSVGADEMSYTVTGLSASTTYYWKVTVADANGASTSAVRSFTTE